VTWLAVAAYLPAGVFLPQLRQAVLNVLFKLIISAVLAGLLLFAGSRSTNALAAVMAWLSALSSVPSGVAFQPEFLWRPLASVSCLQAPGLSWYSPRSPPAAA
jgi:hypothetical protein